MALGQRHTANGIHFKKEKIEKDIKLGNNYLKLMAYLLCLENLSALKQ